MTASCITAQEIFSQSSVLLSFYLVIFSNFYICLCVSALMVSTFRVQQVVYTTNTFMYSKFLKAIQSFVCQYNILLPPFVYFNPAFFNGFFLCSSRSFGLSRQCLIVALMSLQPRSNLLYQHFYDFVLDNNFFVSFNIQMN